MIWQGPRQRPSRSIQPDPRMPVVYQTVGSVVIVTIDRPERRNAIDRGTAVALKEAWQRFEADDEALVGILTGKDGVFSSGADLKAFDLIDDPDGSLGFTRVTLSKPTIAAIEGYCVAGGLEMALWCDLRVAGEGAIFGCLERRFGVPLVDGGTQRLPAIVGLGRALDLILTGRTVAADEALAMGLIDRRVPDSQALSAAIELATAIASYPQNAVLSDRAAVLGGLGMTVPEGLKVERRLGLESIPSGAEVAARFSARGADGGS